MAFTGSQNLALLVLLVAVFNTRYHVSSQSLAPGFYSTTCPRAESIITATVTNHVRAKADNAPGLLRMFFHDCFVQGCDGSILIDGPSTEKTAGPNTLLRGFDVIDDAKSQIEAVCPGVVSCADILAIAARDCVVLTGGPFWRVPTGRRDGTVSSASDTSNLPAFRDSMDVQLRKFQDKGLSIQDLVTLVGGHTIGTSQCQFFTYRLANFNGTTSPDPSLNPAFIQEFQNFCNGNATRRMDLDRGSGNRFDTSFYGNVNRGAGVLESDQKLWTDPRTRVFVQRLLGLSGLLGLRFTVEFPSAMIRMGNIEVKTGSQGEIRRVCTRVN